MKKFLSVFFACFLFFLIPVICFASSGSYTAYSSVLNNNTQAKQLYEAWSTHPAFDPVFDWCIFSVYDSNSRTTNYVLAASDALIHNGSYISSSSDTYVIELDQHSSTQSSPSYYSLTYSFFDSISIYASNFSLLGNISYCSLPDYADNNKYNFIVSTLIVLICFCLLFFIFRIRFDKDRGFRL